MNPLIEPPPTLVSSGCKAAVFSVPYRRTPRTFIMFHGGELKSFEPPPHDTVTDGWASGSAYTATLTLGVRRWLFFSWCISPRHLPFEDHAALLDEHEPGASVRWSEHQADVRTRWDSDGCRVRLTLNRLMSDRLIGMEEGGEWLYRILQPRLCCASVRIIRRTHLHLFIPA